MRGKQNGQRPITSQENIMASIHSFPGSPFERALAAGVQAKVRTGKDKSVNRNAIWCPFRNAKWPESSRLRILYRTPR